MDSGNSGRTSRYYWLCPLYSFDSYSGNVDLVKGIQLKRTTFGFQRYLEGQDSDWFWASPSNTMYMIAFPEITPGSDKPKSFFEYKYIDKHPSDLLIDLITAFRLCHTGMVTPGPLILAEFEDSTFYMYKPDNISPGIRFGPIWTYASKFGDEPFAEPKYRLSQADVPKINKLFKNLIKLRDKANKTGSLDIALTRFNSAYHGTSEDRLIDQMIAFESLYTGDDKELGYKLALRTAFLLAKNVHEREAIFNDMKRAYDIRGKVVHGSKKVETSELEETIPKTEEYLRQSIRRLLALSLTGYSLDSLNKGKNKKLAKLDENVLSNGDLLDTE